MQIPRVFRYGIPQKISVDRYDLRMKLMNKKGKPDAISLPNTSGLCYVAIELTKTIRVVSDAIVLPVTTGIAIFGIKMAPRSFDVF